MEDVEEISRLKIHISYLISKLYCLKNNGEAKLNAWNRLLLLSEMQLVAKTGEREGDAWQRVEGRLFRISRFGV